MREILITYCLGYLVLIVAYCIYSLLGFRDLNFFIHNICSFFIIFFFAFASFYLYLKNRKKEKKINFQSCLICFSLGISIALFLNSIILYFHPTVQKNDFSIYLMFVSSGIVGPLFEEILFRYIFYNRLKNKYSVNKSIILCTSIFALIHLSPIKMIYSFILGLFFAIVYEKKESIIAPIIIHIGANSIVLLLTNFNIYILILSFINLIISSYLTFK